VADGLCEVRILLVGLVVMELQTVTYIGEDSTRKQRWEICKSRRSCSSVVRAVPSLEDLECSLVAVEGATCVVVAGSARAPRIDVVRAVGRMAQKPCPAQAVVE
jgi:hypothetical protein